MNYTEFSSWMGPFIQQSEGFYFRHDSLRNPQYENFNEKKRNSQVIIKTLMSDEQIERMVTDKMREQWSTMKKAFSELSKERLGHISKKELQS